MTGLPTLRLNVWLFNVMPTLVGVMKFTVRCTVSVLLLRFSVSELSKLRFVICQPDSLPFLYNVIDGNEDPPAPTFPAVVLEPVLPPLEDTMPPPDDDPPPPEETGGDATTGLYAADDVAIDVTSCAESVIVTDTASVCADVTVGAIVHVDVVDMQSDAEGLTPDGSVHE
jgi:hypothetical protein